MTDVWDYRLKKMEIAWELAKVIMPSVVDQDKIRWHLKWAMETIEDTFPDVPSLKSGAQEAPYYPDVSTPESRGDYSR